MTDIGRYSNQSIYFGSLHTKTISIYSGYCQFNYIGFLFLHLFVVKRFVLYVNIKNCSFLKSF